jgi:hypothetical protein
VFKLFQDVKVHSEIRKKFNSNVLFQDAVAEDKDTKMVDSPSVEDFGTETDVETKDAITETNQVCSFCRGINIKKTCHHFI